MNEGEQVWFVVVEITEATPASVFCYTTEQILQSFRADRWSAMHQGQMLTQ